MAKSNSVNIAEVLNSQGTNPQAETKGMRMTIKPTRFHASVKADGTMKTISLHNIRISVDTAELAASTGFPLGSVIAVNAYLPVKRATKEQLSRSVKNWQAAKANKGDTSGNVINVSEVELEDEGDDE